MAVEGKKGCGYRGEEGVAVEGRDEYGYGEGACGLPCRMGSRSCGPDPVSDTP